MRKIVPLRDSEIKKDVLKSRFITFGCASGDNEGDGLPATLIILYNIFSRAQYTILRPEILAILTYFFMSCKSFE